MTSLRVSPCRRDCQSGGQALDARDRPCLFRESLRARFWSPFRRKTRWLCVRQKHVHRHRDRASIYRRSRCGKFRAGDRTSRPPRKQSTATRIRSPQSNPCPARLRIRLPRWLLSDGLRERTHQRPPSMGRCISPYVSPTSSQARRASRTTSQRL
jgi:hypothetical protein